MASDSGFSSLLDPAEWGYSGLPSLLDPLAWIYRAVEKGHLAPWEIEAMKQQVRSATAQAKRGRPPEEIAAAQNEAMALFDRTLATVAPPDRTWLWLVLGAGALFFWFTRR